LALITVMVYHGTARFVGPAWMVVGIVGYVLYRRHQGIPLTETVEREPASVLWALGNSLPAS
jgi:hypothetical protein